ncbi:MAG: TolC family protein [Deltaproteobacteria bacterium]|nr:TolC family protein [Deltaproteobacteria bacterium]
MLSGLLAILVHLAAGPLTLVDARKLADEHSAQLHAAEAAARAGQAGVDSAGQLANPTLSVSYGHDDPQLTAGLDVRVPLFGQRGAAIASAEASAQAAGAEVPVQRARLHASVRRALAAAWAAQEAERLSQEASKLAAQLEQMANDRLRTGSASQLEVEQAAINRKRSEQETDDRVAETRAARAELAALLGVTDEPEAAAPEALAQTPAVELLLERGARHPELEALRAQESLALARADEERTAPRPLPVFSIIGQRSTADASLGLRVGIAFDLPVLSLNRGKVQEQESLARAANAQALAAQQRFAGQVRAARARYGAAQARAAFYSGDFVVAARRVVELAQAAWRIGRAPLSQVTAAQSELAGAQLRGVDAVLEAQRALADLEEAIGADL